MAAPRGFPALMLGLREAPWRHILNVFDAPWEIDRRDLCLLDSEECILWLRVKERQGFPAVPPDLDLVCEALHVLTLLARVDFDSWVDEMFKIWPDHQEHRAWVEFELKPVALQRLLRFGLLLVAANPDSVHDLVGLCVANNTRTQSQEYLECCEFLLQDRDLSLGGLEEPHWQVPVCIEHDYLNQTNKNVAEMMNSTLGVAKAVQRTFQFDLEQDDKVAHSLLKPRFVIHEVRSMVYRNGIVNMDSLQVLAQLVKRGVRVGSMSIVTTIATQWDQHERTKELAGALRGLTVQDDDIAEVNSGIRFVRVSHEHSRDAMLALLSAISSSQCVRDVEIDLYEEEGSDDEEMEEEDEEDDDRGGDWEWVAYHLFSRFAHHNIHSLGLNLRDLKFEEVDAIRDLLNDTNPLARLDGRHDESDGDEPQELIASRFCVSFPGDVQAGNEAFSNKSEEYMFTTPEPATVRVISEPVEGEGPWWMVVLPGLSFAWVHQEDIMSFASSTTQDQLATRPVFPTIVITDMSDSAIESSVELLTLIGQGTSRIVLREYRYITIESLDDWCSAVLQACPQLAELQLMSAPLESLHVFVTAAEAGYCRLRYLNVQRIPITNSDHTCAFFAALCDPQYPLTAHLERLDLTFFIERNCLDEIIHAAVQMLERNRRLQHVRLSLHLAADFRSCTEEIQQAFASQLEAQVMIRVAPLNIGSKLAFLSVVDDKISGRNAWSRLDSGVMSEILEYAAVGRVRRCQVDIPEPLS